LNSSVLFVILHQDRKWLESILGKTHFFLFEKLHLTLHPDKISIKTFASGVDFLGWVHFPAHRVLRTVTKKRVFRNIMMKIANDDAKKLDATIQSYLGVLSHGNAQGLASIISEIQKSA
jgi:hypothetical protein